MALLGGVTMTTVTIELPDTLRKRTEQIARDQGSTMNELITQLLEEYLEDIEDGREAAAITTRIASGAERTYMHGEVWANIDDDTSAQ